MITQPTWIVQLADSKYLLGRRFSEWTNRAPALEAAVAAAAMTQDEFGHARGLYAMLQNAPDAPEAYLEQERRAQLSGAPILEQPFQNWMEFIAAVGLFDRAMTLTFEALLDANPPTTAWSDPLRQRAAKIAQEEWFHRQYGAGWLRQLAAQTKTRDAMQDAVKRFWQPTSDWLAAMEQAAFADGALTGNQILRQRWSDETKTLLTQCGLAMP